MAEDKKSFLLYCDLIHTIEKLPNDKAGELFKHILAYVNDKNPQTDDLIINITFEPIKQQLKRDLIKYMNIRDKRQQAGLASAEKRKHMSTHVEQNEHMSTVNDTVNVNVNVNDNVNDNVNVNVSSVANATAQPTKKTVAIEARREQLLTDMRKYANIYSSEMLNAFYQYWSEPNQKNTKMRFELEKTWLLSSRLATWEKRENNYKKNSYGKNFTNTAKLSNETIRNIVESNDAGSFGEK